MKNNKLNMQGKGLRQANQKHIIAKLKGCLIKGRPVTSRPLNSNNSLIVGSQNNFQNSTHFQHPKKGYYITSSPLVKLYEQPRLDNCSPPLKNECREKKPIVRSFIIKQSSEISPQSILYNCDAQHNNFVNKLSQCIKKRSLTTSKQYKNNIFKNREYNKAKQFYHGSGCNTETKMLCQSFNNVKVKKSLENIFLLENNLTLSPKNSLKNKYGRKTETKTRDSYKNIQISDKNNSPFLSPSKQMQKTEENNIFCQYTDITEYMKEQNTTINKDKQIEVPSLFSSNFSNFSNLCNLKYRRKRKESLKLSSCKGNKNQLTKSNHREPFIKSIAKGSDGSMPGSCLSDGKKLRIMPDNKCEQRVQEDFKVQDLQIFSQIMLHTPKKRKIQTSFYSPEKIFGSSLEKSHVKQKSQVQAVDLEQNTLGVPTQQCQQGYSCYLRTVNF